MIITIIGNGFVGKATSLLRSNETKVWIYDVLPELRSPFYLDYDLINKNSDLIFVCVPTPMNIDGSCNTGIVSSVLDKLDHPFVIVRSTVPIGFCDSMDLFFMPEFLTEKNWPQDFKNNKNWIFGYPHNISESRLKTFQSHTQNLIKFANSESSILYSKTTYCHNKEAELIKLIRNNFLSTKVAFFNEIYDLCTVLNLDYSVVQYGVSEDPRIGISHTYISENLRGYGGTCFPKDTNSLHHIFLENGLSSHLLEANLLRNEYTDRKSKDWLYSYNRAITNYDGKIYLIINPLKTVSPEPNLKKIVFNSLTLDTYPDVLYHSWNGKTKIFLPRVDHVFYFLNENVSIGKRIQEIQNVLDFVSTYELPLSVTFKKSDNNHVLIKWIISEYPKTEIL